MNEVARNIAHAPRAGVPRRGEATEPRHDVGAEAAGLSVERVAAHHDVLPPRVISRLEHEALAVARAVRDDGTRYRFGKMATTWLGRGTDGNWPAARCAIELAIHRLFSLAFGASPAASRISGAEWWVQHTPSVNFHYDKDEALASEQMTMAFPEVSTVTYLSSRGDPTFVLDQTTPDGNHNEPTVPSDADAPRVLCAGERACANRRLSRRAAVEAPPPPRRASHQENSPANAIRLTLLAYTLVVSLVCCCIRK